MFQMEQSSLETLPGNKVHRSPKNVSAPDHRQKSIVFICPDYHCSFLYRDELRRRGWRADIYLPPGYPRELIYGTPDLEARNPGSKRLSSLIPVQLSVMLNFIKCLYRYRYHFYYGRLEHFSLQELRVPFLGPRIVGFRSHLFITKLLRRKVIYLPSGTPDEVAVDLLRTFGNDEEGVAVEDRRSNEVHLAAVAKYSDMSVGTGFVHTAEFPQTHFQYKCLDLSRWKPNIEVPSKFLLPPLPSSTLRILHSFMFGDERRALQGGDIKGTHYVIEAVERLKSEGFQVELMMFDRVPSRDYIYIQAQADIVVEELIRGCWGSTAIECMALGKPVLTFIRPEWEQNYLRTFPEVKSLPICNTSKHNIYENLRKVVTDVEYRADLSKRGREFAERFLDVRKNVTDFEAKLLSLDDSR